MLVVDDQERFPIKKEGVVFGGGTQVKIKLSKVYARVMPDPYSDCMEPDTIDTLISREMKRLKMNYNRRNCLLLCQQKLIIDKMGCYDLSLPPVFNASPCFTDQQFEEISNFNLSLSKNHTYFMEIIVRIHFFLVV